MLCTIYRPQGYSREERQDTPSVSADEHGAQSETNRKLIEHLEP